MNVYIAPSSDLPGAWTGGYEHVLWLASCRKAPRHTLIDDPVRADVILLMDSNDDDDFESLRTNPLARKYPEKTFAAYEADYPRRYLPGLYTSMPRSRWNLNRFKPWMYSYTQRKKPSTIALAKDLPRTGELFFSFVGRASADVRARLFEWKPDRPDVLIEDSSHFDYFGAQNSSWEAAQTHYASVCARSRFVLCPRGKATGSIRLFEMMQLGIAPVILSDAWIPPHGPDWSSFAVFVPERQVREIPNLLQQYDPEWQAMGRKARAAWDQWFAPEVEFDYMMDQLAVIMRERWISERLVRLTWPLMRLDRILRTSIRRAASSLRR